MASSIASEEGFVYVTLLFICALGFMANILVCALIVCKQCLRTPTNYFIFSLCITNTLFEGVLIPMHCFARTTRVYPYLNIMIIIMYTCNLTATTFERYVSISYPLQYHTIITERKTIQLIILCYFIPVAYCLIPLAWNGIEYETMHKIYMIATLLIFLAAPFGFIVAVYIKVYYVTHMFFKEHRKNIVVRKTNTESEDEHHDNGLSELKFLCCLHRTRLKEPKIGEVAGTLLMASTLVLNDNADDDVENSSETTLFNMEKMFSHRTASIKYKFRKSQSLDGQALEAKINEMMKPKKTKALNRSSSESDKLIHGDRMREKKRGTSLRSLHNFHIRTKQKLRQLKASFAFVLVAVTYLFTWLPVVYMTILGLLNKHIPHWLSIVSVYTIGLSSMLDPFLYALLLKDFRITLKLMIKKRSARKWGAS